MRNGAILEFKDVLTEGAENNPRTLMQSHFEGEVWGLAPVDGDRVLTTCDDNKVLLFNFATRQLESSGTISQNRKIKATRKSTASSSSQFAANKQARAIAFSKKHGHVVLCSNLGKVSIRAFEDFDKKIQTLKDAEEWCEVVRYSP